MELLIYLVVLVIVLSFGLIVFVGAPYVPTLTPQVAAALKLADLQPGQTMLELGSGDGKVLIAAAQQGIQVVGYELNPFLVVISWLRTRRYRQLVTIKMGNFWNTSWPKAEVIFVFLHPRFMQKLDKKIIQYNHKPVNLVSFAFEVPNRKPVTKLQGVLLYEYK
jgi:hypothetical protein